MKDHGRVNHCRAHIEILNRHFSFCFANDPISEGITAEDVENQALIQMYREQHSPKQCENLRQVAYSEMTELSNQNFDRFQNEIYPTRF